MAGETLEHTDTTGVILFGLLMGERRPSTTPPLAISPDDKIFSPRKKRALLPIASRAKKCDMIGIGGEDNGRDSPWLR